jgi:hypothetical protein
MPFKKFKGWPAASLAKFKKWMLKVRLHCFDLGLVVHGVNST